MTGIIHKLSVLVLLLAAILLSGCISQNGPQAPDATGPGNDLQTGQDGQSSNSTDKDSGKIRVVATIAPLGEFVKEVGGDRAIVAVIVPPAAEPHTFEPTPSQMTGLANADLYVKNGAGLEFWLDRVLQSNENLPVIDSSQGINFLNESEDEIDPHIWLSLRNAAIQVKNICSGLCHVDPRNESFYINNRDSYLQKLKDLDDQFNNSFASKKMKIFVVHHPAWTYFARDYNLTQVSLMEEEKEPGPRYLTEVIALARQNNITTIFAEPQFNPKSAEVIAAEMNASIITLNPLAENYLENMRYAGQEIANSMNG